MNADFRAAQKAYDQMEPNWIDNEETAEIIQEDIDCGLFEEDPNFLDDYYTDEHSDKVAKLVSILIQSDSFLWQPDGCYLVGEELLQARQDLIDLIIDEKAELEAA